MFDKQTLLNLKKILEFQYYYFWLEDQKNNNFSGLLSSNTIFIKQQLDVVIDEINNYATYINYYNKYNKKKGKINNKISWFKKILKFKNKHAKI